MKGGFASLQDLNAQVELFKDSERPDCENIGPFLIVKDDFYPDPDTVREKALSKEFFQYFPPLPEQVDGLNRSGLDVPPAWMSTSLLRYLGKPVKNPRPGYRYSSADVQNLIQDGIGEFVDTDTWDGMGDWWNGAFHVQLHTWSRDKGAIHHHYKDGDVCPRGWSGVVYLSPNPLPEAGTSIWLEMSTHKCVAPKGAKFDWSSENYELAYLSVQIVHVVSLQCRLVLPCFATVRGSQHSPAFPGSPTGLSVAREEN